MSVNRGTERTVHEEDVGTSEAETTTEEKKKGLFSTLPPSVWYVYISTMLIVIGNTCSSPVLVLYLNLRGWTTKEDVTFYTVLTVVGTLLPVVANPLFGLWQGRRPTKEIFLFDGIVTGYGFLMMAVVDEPWLFFAGFCLSRIPFCQRSTRLTYVVRTTSDEDRTQAVSLLPFFALGGALLGPLVTILCALAPSWIVSGMLINSLNLTYWVASALSFLRIPLLIFGFAEERFSDASSSSSSSSSALSHDSSGSSLAAEEEANMLEAKRRKEEKKMVWNWVIFFCILDLLANGTLGIFILTLQPILVNIYDFTQLLMASFILVLALCTMVPPVAMGILGKRFGVADRVFIVVGLAGMLLGGVIYALPPGALPITVLGSVISFPFSAMYGPASNTLFSKIVGVKNASGVKYGLIISASTLGSAVGSLIGGPVALPLYTSPLFLLFCTPLAVCIPVALFAWPRLVPKPQETLAVASDVESQQRLSSHSQGHDEERRPLLTGSRN